jgi:hypothetical protein
MKTLIEKAKAHKTNRKVKNDITDQHVELALEFLRGEVSLTQTSAGLGLKEACFGSYAIIVRSLLKAYRDKRIKINKKV